MRGQSLVLNYYQPWVWAGSERFTQLIDEELRQGGQPTYVYVVDGGLESVRQAMVLEQRYSGLRLFRAQDGGTILTPESPSARSLTDGKAIPFEQLLNHLRPKCARAHFPADAFVKHFELVRAARIPFVYDIMDLWADFPATPWGTDVVERWYLDSADAVTAVSKFLLEKHSLAVRGHLIPNAVDAEFLVQLRPPDLRQPGRPRVLYMGGMAGWWFDWTISVELPGLFPEADFTFVGALEPPPEESAAQAGDGDIAAYVAELESFSNCRVVAEVPHGDLVPYLRNVDIGLIPFQESELTRAVSPLKVFEYLGAGARVLQLGMPDIQGYPGVYTADCPTDFTRRVGDLLATAAEFAGQDELHQFATRNTWRQRLDVFNTVLSRLEDSPLI